MDDELQRTGRAVSSMAGHIIIVWLWDSSLSWKSTQKCRYKDQIWMLTSCNYHHQHAFKRFATTSQTIQRLLMKWSGWMHIEQVRIKYPHAAQVWSVLGSVRPIVDQRRYIVPEMVCKQKKRRKRTNCGTKFHEVNHSEAVPWNAIRRTSSIGLAWIRM